MSHLIIHILNRTEDIANGIRIRLEIIDDAAVVREALHVAVIGVERPVASWLIGMEIALPKTTYSAMLQYAIIAII